MTLKQRLGSNIGVVLAVTIICNMGVTAGVLSFFHSDSINRAITDVETLWRTKLATAENDWSSKVAALEAQLKACAGQQ